ncbi:MAG: hypothetical protein HY704_04720 [Gemmatimonadetes bacterium]|nr:hypothetical protein [Gemmatimonadota bacterium]
MGTRAARCRAGREGRAGGGARGVARALAGAHGRPAPSRLVDLRGLLCADNGPGLTPDQARSVFEPFVTTKRKGMGLGLPICRTIVEAHGGRVGARRRPESGALFAVQLPLRAPGDDTVAAGAN